MSAEGKMDAWLLMLGIDIGSDKTKNLLNLYRQFVAL